MAAQDFKRFLFVAKMSPGERSIALMIILFGLFSGLATSFLFNFPLPLMLLVFTVPPLLSALALSAVPKFRAKWAFMVILINQISLFVLNILTLALPGFTITESLILWAVLTFAFVAISLVGLIGISISSKRIWTAIIYPVLVFVLMPRQVVVEAITVREILLLVGGFLGILFILWLMEYLSSFVLKGVSGFRILSTFLQGIRGEQVSLDIGVKINALLQYLVFKQDGQYKLLAAPWLHGGPLRGVGGGSLSTKMIEKLNEKYPESYFVHIPTNHEMDPVSRNVVTRLMEKISVGEGPILRVSGIVESSDNEVRVRGQRINDTLLIFLNCKNIDDYDTSIALNLKDHSPEKVIIIDQHLHHPLSVSDDAIQFTNLAERVELHVDNVIKKLRVQPMNFAKLGAGISFFNSISAYAMVMETHKTKTCYFIIDCNGQDSAGVKSIEEIARGMGIDDIIVMTTDSHSSNVREMVEINRLPDVTIMQLIESALKTKNAKVLYKEVTIPNVPILGHLYYELTTIVKILSRVFMVLFVSFLLFFGLIILIT